MNQGNHCCGVHAAAAMQDSLHSILPYRRGAWKILMSLARAGPDFNCGTDRLGFVIAQNGRAGKAHTASECHLDNVHVNNKQ